MAAISYGSDAPETINVVIEIQRGQRNKYEVDKDTGLLMLDRVTPVAMAYPADYGYVPDTLCEDGDPLDALLIIDESVVHGAVVKARPLGVLNMVDDGEGDEKLICVADDDLTKKHIRSLGDLGADFTKVIEHFYMHYKDWKKDWQGSPVSFNGWGNEADAKRIIMESIERAKAQGTTHDVGDVVG